MLLSALIYFIFKIIFFSIGFISAFLVIILGLVLLGFRIERKGNKVRRVPKYMDSFSENDSNLSFNWLNHLIWIAYPKIINKHFIEEKVHEAIKEVPKNVNTISSIEINNLKFHEKPPSFNDLLITDDGFGFQIDYEPNLVLDSNVTLNLPYLSNILLDALFIFHEFHGNFKITISKDGMLKIIIDDAKNLDFDIKAGIGNTVAMDTQQLESVWSTLKQWINTYIHQIAVYLSIKELIDYILNMLENKQQKFPIVIGPKKLS